MSSQMDMSNDPGYCRRNAPGTAFIVVSSILFSIATVAVPLRLWTRLRLKESTFGVDDICLILAYVFVIPTLSLMWRMSVLGLGRHRQCYSDHDLIRALEFEYIAEFLMIFSTMFSRASVALFVTRLFAVTKRVRIALYCYTAFMCVSLIVTACLIWAQCTPVQALWNYHLLLEGKATCWSKSGLYFVDYYNSAISILSDSLLAMLPAYFLSKLQMPFSLKISLMLLMAIGIVPMVCAVLRTAFASTQASETDPLYNSALLLVFGSTETLVLIICASVTALRPFFRLVQVRLSNIDSSWFSSRGSFGKPGRLNGDAEKDANGVNVVRSWSVRHSNDSDNAGSQSESTAPPQNASSTL